MSARTSIVRQDTIDYTFWLVFDATGGMRFTRTEPTAGRGERKMQCATTLPRSLFSTPNLKATITVDQAAGAVFDIDVTAAADALRGVVGCDVDLRVERADA